MFLNDNLFQVRSIKIAQALRSISSLTRLEFNNNGLPDSVAEDLAAAIVSNSGLNSIGIMNSDFEASGVIAGHYTTYAEIKTYHICDRPCENRPCSHLVVIRETPV